MVKNKKEKGSNYLDKVPVFQSEHSWKQDENGLVTIYIENKGIFHTLAQKFLKKPKVSQIHLDEMGSFILPLIDGNRSIYDISLCVKAQFGEKAEPLYNRLVTYMHTLEQYGFISVK